MVGIGEDKSEEIAAIEAAGHHVLVQQIIAPRPRSEDVLTPGLVRIRDETERQQAEEAETMANMHRAPRLIPQTDERPFPLSYPKQVF